MGMSRAAMPIIDKKGDQPMKLVEQKIDELET
jgi:hypothetical protein